VKNFHRSKLYRQLGSMADLKMTDLQSDVWHFMLERFVGVENAAPRSSPGHRWRRHFVQISKAIEEARRVLQR